MNGLINRRGFVPCHNSSRDRLDHLGRFGTDTENSAQLGGRSIYTTPFPFLTVEDELVEKIFRLRFVAESGFVAGQAT